MASRTKSRVLTEHEEIRRWAEERGARPSAVRRTHSDDNTGIIRLDFPGYSGANSLEEISWDEWFEDFEDRNLALIVQDGTADGKQSNFNKLVSRESVETGSEETPSSRRRSPGPRGTSTRRSGSQSTKKTRRARSSSATASTKSRSSKSRSGAGKKTTERSRTNRRKAA